MTIAELIDLLKPLPGECIGPFMVCRRHSLGWDDAHVDGFTFYLTKHYAQILADTGEALIRERTDSGMTEQKGSIHDPDFRAKFCAFLKEHFS